jgi:hypothetical protein
MKRIRDRVIQKLEERLGVNAEIFSVSAFRSEYDYSRVIVSIDIGNLIHTYQEMYFDFGKDPLDFNMLDRAVDHMMRTLLVEGMMLGTHKLSEIALKLMGSERVK